MIDHDKRLIFVHIQKTGGNSVAAALGLHPDCPEKHHFAPSLRTRYGEAAWGAYFKFSFVRNPWDRLVSWWSMIDAQRPAFEAGAPINRFQSFILRSASTFDEFLDNCDEEIADGDGRKWIYRNQSDYLTDASGAPLVDFIGRYERIEQDFGNALLRAGLTSVALPRVNASIRRPYAEYFTPAQAAKVGQRFAKDVTTFGYAFGE
jgi:hypothetical protein